MSGGEKLFSGPYGDADRVISVMRKEDLGGKFPRGSKVGSRTSQGVRRRSTLAVSRARGEKNIGRKVVSKKKLFRS